VLTAPTNYGIYKAPGPSGSDSLCGTRDPGRINGPDLEFHKTTVKYVTTPVTEKRPIRVLLIEDDASDIFLFQTVLAEARAAIELTVVDRLRGAVKALQESLIDLIVTDLSLPDSGEASTFRELRKHAPQIPIIVLTTGVGMAENVRLRCFEPFYSTKADHGTGLGLAMVFGIVRRHEGEIEVESSPGLGTTISISLLPHEEIKGTASAAGVPQASRPARILVVDDEPSVREVLQACFQEDGHFVGLAADGQEGLERFISGQWDIVVTDRAMPRLNGDQLAAEIKKIRPDVPVILVTGFADVMHDVGDHPPEIDRIVAKPFTRNALREAVGQVLAANGRISAEEKPAPTAAGDAQQATARPGTAGLERSNQLE
jgi:CheY-like chemotaxis protein